MQIWALIIAIAAAVGFLIEAVIAKSIAAGALSLLTVAWIVQTCVLTGTHVLAH